MTDFVIVLATAVALVAPASTPAAVAPDAHLKAASAIPSDAPTVGFRTYGDLASCERATAVLAAPAGARLVCLPVEPLTGELASAY
jgi:hypothetical protein